MAVQRLPGAGRALGGRELVLPHVAHRARGKDARAVQLAAAREHLRKARVVVQRGHEPRAAGLEGGLPVVQGQDAQVRARPAHELRALLAVDRGKAAALFLGQEEARVLHL